MGVTAADFDNDGWDDIYVANDRTENFLFHNKHDGTFEEIANDTGTAFGQNGESTSSMGPVFADLEGRGVLDLWVTDGHYNRLLHNTGKMSFEDMGASNGVSQTNAQYVSWGTGVYDFDNDGLLDILIFHGGLIHLIPQEHTLFRGLGDGRFRRCFARGRAGAERAHRGARRMFCRLRQRRQSGCIRGESGRARERWCTTSPTDTGHWIAIKLVARAGQPGRRAIATASARGLKCLPAGKRQTAERVAELRVSVAERRPPALRIGRGNDGGQAASFTGRAGASRRWKN